MAQNKNDKQPTQDSGQGPEQIVQGDEFDSAVTTQLPDGLLRAFENDRTTDPDDGLITDMQLTAQVEPSDDGAIEPGFVLNGRFEIVELVHGGGMSHVYKAVDRRRHPGGAGDVHVAIKTMRPSISSQENSRLALEREAAKAQSLSHPNIINVFDFDAHDEQFFLVMEWLEGESVNTLLRRTSGSGLASSFAWPVIEGAAKGVQHAHQNDVVHADINPSNIFITDTQDVKLLDFGVARYASTGEQSEDDQIAWVTQTYASPEVLSGQTPVFEDDVFSLGCVAYRLLSGKHPFGGSPSLVAKHEGMSVERIPWLSDSDWRVLRQTLFYERSDRPSNVSAFITRAADAAADGFVARVTRHFSPLRTSLAAVVALAVLAGGWWLQQSSSDGETAPIAEAAGPEVRAVADMVAAPTVSAAGLLVLAAVEAVDDGKLVSPDEGNARALFREALVLEPNNTEALHGLRAISDDYVRRAHAALSSDDPLKAYGALEVAAETDVGNPAIEFVAQLLAEKGHRELADARLAASTGNYGVAAERLSRAEQYTAIDPDAVESIRQQIMRSREDDEFLDGLAAAETHIAAGRLISPDGESAHGLLLDLYQVRGDDARLLASMERLGNRLLTRVAFATAAESFAEATELLDFVDRLGVLGPEVESARTSVEAAIAPLAAADTPERETVRVAEEIKSTSRDETKPETVAAVTPKAEGSAQGPVAASTDGAMTESAQLPQRKTLEDLGIERYVAPRFPRRAQHRRLTGLVDVEFNINVDGRTDSIDVLRSEPGDVFVNSAVKAVRQWRFAPRDDVESAKITLRFELAPE